MMIANVLILQPDSVFSTPNDNDLHTVVHDHLDERDIDNRFGGLLNGEMT